MGRLLFCFLVNHKVQIRDKAVVPKEGEGEEGRKDETGWRRQSIAKL